MRVDLGRILKLSLAMLARHLRTAFQFEKLYIENTCSLGVVPGERERKEKVVIFSVTYVLSILDKAS